MSGVKGRSGTTKGYASPKRNEIQKDLDRCRLAELLREGWTKGAIAQELGVSPATISRDYKIMIKEWHDGRDLHLDEYITLKLEELGHIKRNAWQAYKASKTVMKPCWKEDPKTHVMTMEMVETPCEPNTVHLRVALEALKEECELVGAYPQKGSSKGGDNGQGNITANFWQVLMGRIPPPGQPVSNEVEDEIEQLLQRRLAIEKRTETIEVNAVRGESEVCSTAHGS